MSKLIRRATAHFTQEVCGELLRLEVPEWGEGDNPQIIYYRPKMNFLQQRIVKEYFDKGDFAGATVQTLIFRAVDEERQPLFSEGDKQELLREVDPDLLVDICTRMMKSEDEASIDELVKN